MEMVSRVESNSNPHFSLSNYSFLGKRYKRWGGEIRRNLFAESCGLEENSNSGWELAGSFQTLNKRTAASRLRRNDALTDEYRC